MFENARLAEWAGDQDALARWPTALLRERANMMVLDDAVDEKSLRLAEREHRAAVGLTQLELGDLTDDDLARLRLRLTRAAWA